MKKTLKMCVNIVALMAVLSIAVAGCTSSGGSSSSGGTTSDPAESLSGNVAKGHVEGARVFADKIPDGETRGDLVYSQAAGEVSCRTDSNGEYSLEVPENYGDYMLVSQGGTIIKSDGSEEPAPPMLAPSDAGNITPVTTMVALYPALRAKVGEELFDQDIADAGGTNGAVLAMAMAAKAVLDSLEANVAMTNAQRFSVVAALAEEFEDVEDLTDGSLIAAATRTAVAAVLEDETVFDPDEEVDFDGAAAADAIGNAVSTIVAGINLEGTAYENEDLEDIVDAAIVISKPAVGTAITKLVKVSITSAALQNSSGGDVLSIQEAVTTEELTLTEANSVESIVFTFTGRNDFSRKDYSAAQLILDISDTFSENSREATATITGIEMIVAATDNDTSTAENVTFDLSADTQVLIEGTDSEGNPVTATLDNTATEGDAIVVRSGNGLKLNLVALDERIKDVVESTDALFDIGRTGNFKISVSGVDIPLASATKSIDVE